MIVGIHGQFLSTHMILLHLRWMFTAGTELVLVHPQEICQLVPILRWGLCWVHGNLSQLEDPIDLAVPLEKFEAQDKSCDLGE